MRQWKDGSMAYFQSEATTSVIVSLCAPPHTPFISRTSAQEVRHRPCDTVWYAVGASRATPHTALQLGGHLTYRPSQPSNPCLFRVADELQLQPSAVSTIVDFSIIVDFSLYTITKPQHG